MNNSGSIPFVEPERERVAGAIAGALAEHGVLRLTIADPRVCRARELVCGETNLPAELLAATPGTTFSGVGVALLIEQGRVCWVSSGGFARALGTLAVDSDRG